MSSEMWYLLLMGFAEHWVGIIMVTVSLFKKSNTVFVLGFFFQLFLSFMTIHMYGQHIHTIVPLVAFIVYSGLVFFRIYKVRFA